MRTVKEIISEICSEYKINNNIYVNEEYSCPGYNIGEEEVVLDDLQRTELYIYNLFDNSLHVRGYLCCFLDLEDLDIKSKFCVFTSDELEEVINDFIKSY